MENYFLVSSSLQASMVMILLGGGDGGRAL